MVKAHHQLTIVYSSQELFLLTTINLYIIFTLILNLLKSEQLYISPIYVF